MAEPSLADCLEYLGDTEWNEDDVESAYNTEKAAQVHVCKIPDDIPEDLIEALYRRVAANLANRALPLGLQAVIGETFASTARVGGGDREVKRLEGPFRKRLVG